ncbi:protein TALPID3 isoform X3 [Gouania willdenowi]|uniref:protein TALPID3 isoform X3 n=1 Tax=Gouania willdenowi TaxID=441366 RepID=UPI001055A31D|nr:protein TALPID3 isoform X3 [Gouania willdenowi]
MPPPVRHRDQCCSDTVGVLLRSTRVNPPDRGPGAAPVTVRELRGCPRGPQPKMGDTRRAAEAVQDGARDKLETELCDDQQTHSAPELMTSRFSAGGREKLLAALRERSHSAPHRREVKVTLAQKSLFSSHDAPGHAQGRGAQCDYHGSANNTAAASLMEATVPLIKAHTALDAQLDQLNDGVQKLLQTERGRVQQHQETMQSHSEQRRLLESALRLVTSHAQTDNTAVAPPTLPYTAGPMPVTMETEPCLQQPRENLQVHDASKPANQSHRAAIRRLKEAGRVRAELKQSVDPGPLEEAAQVLRLVRRQKTLLEENLQSMQRNSSGQGLSVNRVRNTVEAWISLQTQSSAHEAPDTAVMSRRPANRTKPGGGGRRAGRPEGAEPHRVSDGENLLTRVYGRAPHQGLRRTLKKSPYLRLSSPSSTPLKKPRPRIVESVRGLKMKSCKTQTSPPVAPPPLWIPPIALAPPPPPVTMAIPLGRPRIKTTSRHEHPTLTSSPPTEAPPTENPPTDVTSQLQQVQVDQVPPTLNIAEAVDGRSDEEEEKKLLPQSELLCVADEQSLSPSQVYKQEEVLEVDGAPSPPLVQYQGPSFPPRAPSTHHQNPLQSIQQNAMEHQLVEWLEQQLMFKMISEMFPPPPSDPVLHPHADQSDPQEQSSASDTAPPAGGLQLTVDLNMDVDPEVLRQLVNQVLTETLSRMLGQRETLEPRLEPEQGPEDQLLTLLPTPGPSPQTSPTPSSTRATPITTPIATPPPTQPNQDPAQPITEPERVATPTSSPGPAHVKESNDADIEDSPPLTLGNPELPLDEERPEEELKPRPQALWMSVAEEEPPLCSPCPSPAPPLPPELDQRALSSSSSSSFSSYPSSCVLTTAVRHISEGELLHRVTTEEVLPSLCSSLQELQDTDMDLDPPSEGQVGGHQLLRPDTLTGTEDQVSVGEVRDSTNEMSPGRISLTADCCSETNQRRATVGQEVDQSDDNSL